MKQFIKLKKIDNEGDIQYFILPVKNIESVETNHNVKNISTITTYVNGRREGWSTANTIEEIYQLIYSDEV